MMDVKDLQGNVVDIEGLEAIRIKHEARHWLMEAGFNLDKAKQFVNELTKRHGNQAALLNEIDAQHQLWAERELTKARVV